MANIIVTASPSPLPTIPSLGRRERYVLHFMFWRSFLLVSNYSIFKTGARRSGKYKIYKVGKVRNETGKGEVQKKTRICNCYNMDIKQLHIKSSLTKKKKKKTAECKNQRWHISVHEPDIAKRHKARPTKLIQKGGARRKNDSMWEGRLKGRWGPWESGRSHRATTSYLNTHAHTHRRR